MIKKGRILIAESNGIVSKDIQTLLGDWGYESCDFARSDYDALKLIQDAHPDLVIIDTDLRGEFGGEDVAKQINETYNVPVILLTDWMPKEVTRQVEKMKPFYCLSKPFDCGELHHIVDETLTPWQN